VKIDPFIEGVVVFLFTGTLSPTDTIVKRIAGRIVMVAAAVAYAVLSITSKPSSGPYCPHGARILRYSTRRPVDSVPCLAMSFVLEASHGPAATKRSALKVALPPSRDPSNDGCESYR